MLPDTEYFNCDLPSARRALADTELLFGQRPEGSRLVFDEIHRLDNPSDLLKIAAEESWDLDRSQRAIGLLEPLFGDRIAGTGQRHEYALSLLCDLYDDAGWTRKKTKLLERMVTEAPRSTLRSGAFQRMATIRMDRGDRDGAWDAFRRAQRDASGDPAVGLLEVHLLLAENRPERARESARVWRRRLMKLNAEEFEGAIDFLTEVARDPRRALAETFTDATGGAGQRLLDALSGLDGRPLPRYGIAAAPALDPGGDIEADIERQLRGMGISEEDIRAKAPELLEQIRNIERGDGPFDGAAGGAPDPQFTLQAPERLQVLEADWRAIYSPGKPFSIDDAPRQAALPWDPEEEDAWMGFLDRWAGWTPQPKPPGSRWADCRKCGATSCANGRASPASIHTTSRWEARSRRGSIGTRCATSGWANPKRWP